MRKMKLFGVTLLTLALTAMPAAAQKHHGGPDRQSCKAHKTEKCSGDTCSIKKRCCQKEFNPFIGITLSANQQKAIDNLKQQRKAQREEMAKQKKERRTADRQQADSLRKAVRMQAKRNDLNQIKQILTPDQYVVYLENLYIYAPSAKMNGRMDKTNSKMKFEKFSHGDKAKFDKKKSHGGKGKAKSKKD